MSENTIRWDRHDDGAALNGCPASSPAHDNSPQSTAITSPRRTRSSRRPSVARPTNRSVA